MESRNIFLRIKLPSREGVIFYALGENNYKIENQKRKLLHPFSFYLFKNSFISSKNNLYTPIQRIKERGRWGNFPENIYPCMMKDKLIT